MEGEIAPKGRRVGATIARKAPAGQLPSRLPA
uniref:Uncharacterized protein n=1 Tax=Desulfovibrio sp. U5L TaxID=596152 RepID=I2Q6D9_9BACT